MASDESSPWMNSTDDYPPLFEKYLTEDKYLCKRVNGRGWIFQADGQLPTTDAEMKIRVVIENFSTVAFVHDTLFQFWKAVKTREDQYLLTTEQQAFSICGNDFKGLYGYRQVCRNYKYYVDNEAEAGGRLGIPGRVFKYKSFEFTPSVMHYTIQEYPQYHEARHYGIRQLIAFPVFELSNKQCAGVFELITTQCNLLPAWRLICAHCLFKESGLEIPDRHGSCHQGSLLCVQSFHDALPMMELQMALRKVCENPAICVVQAWEPCNDYQPSFDREITDSGYLGLLFRKFSQDISIRLQGLGYSHLMNHIREGQGVAGMAFSSRKLSLCMEISQYSIIDYPLKHLAMEYGWNGIFAICLECNDTRNNVVVLEFSFNYQGDVYTQLYQILKEMKKHLPNFRDSSGQELGEGLPILLINSETNNRHNSMPTPEAREQVQHPSSHVAITRRNDVILGQRNILNPYSQQVEEIKDAVRQHRKSGIPISLEDIKQQFGKKLDDAAESIGVSRSTFKRTCREYGIFWWQSSKRKKDNSPTFYGASIEKVTQSHVPSFTMPSSSRQLHEPPMVSNTSRVQHPGPMETMSNMNVKESAFVEEVTQDEAPPMALDTSRRKHSMLLEIVNNVNIKLVYGHKFAIRFQLSLSSKVEELQEEVVRRLNWVNFETYSIQYIDEDYDWILIGCDEDLRQYMSSSASASSRKTTITLYLKPFKISTQLGSQ